MSLFASKTTPRMAATKMQEMKYQMFEDGDYDCTGVYYTFDLYDGDVTLFVQPDPQDEEFGSGLPLGTVIDAELCEVDQNGQVFYYVRVSALYLTNLYVFR
jgi:hypothetical protein